jgi:hypothetical protein
MEKRVLGLLYLTHGYSRPFVVICLLPFYFIRSLNLANSDSFLLPLCSVTYSLWALRYSVCSIMGVSTFLPGPFYFRLARS